MICARTTAITKFLRPLVIYLWKYHKNAFDLLTCQYRTLIKAIGVKKLFQLGQALLTVFRRDTSFWRLC
jgi:hypothetical protein